MVGGGTHDRLSLHRLTSLLGLLGMSAPCQSPFKQWENWEAGVLLYSRFQESRIILLGGSSSRGFFGFGFGFSSSVWAGVAGAGAAAGVDEPASFGAGWVFSLAGCFAVFASLGGAARIRDSVRLLHLSEPNASAVDAVSRFARYCASIGARLKLPSSSCGCLIEIPLTCAQQAQHSASSLGKRAHVCTS